MAESRADTGEAREAIKSCPRCGGYWQTFENGTFCQRCDYRKGSQPEIEAAGERFTDEDVERAVAAIHAVYDAKGLVRDEQLARAVLSSIEAVPRSEVDRVDEGWEKLYDEAEARCESYRTALEAGRWLCDVTEELRHVAVPDEPGDWTDRHTAMFKQTDEAVAAFRAALEDADQ